MRTRTNHGIKVIAAKGMRQSPTEAETPAWALLRNRRCLGLKFRPQHILHGFVAGFYCAELMLVLEVDGRVHSSPDQAEYDAERTRVLDRSGCHVLRIRNDDLCRERLAALVRPWRDRRRSMPPPHPPGSF